MSMTPDQMLAFVHKMTKQGLESVQHLASGGAVLAGPGGNAVTPNNGPTGLAGSIGNILGTTSGYKAQAAPIQQGTNAAQLNEAYNGVQGALQGAGNLVNTVNPGISQGAGSQDFLTGQLQNQILGQGPNPAQLALNQNTGQNIAQQAALAASVRGAGANPGLTALNAGTIGAGVQQQAVGQNAILQANQQLAAQQQLAGLAAQQVGQGTNAIGLNNQSQQGNQGILQNANASANNALVSNQNNINSTNQAAAAGDQNQAKGILGGIGGALGGIGGAFAKGIQGAYFQGGKVEPHLMEMASIYHPHMKQGNYESGGRVPGKPMVKGDSPKNDVVPAMLSKGEVVIDNATLKANDKLGKMARFVAKEIARKNSGRKA